MSATTGSPLELDPAVSATPTARYPIHTQESWTYHVGAGLRMEPADAPNGRHPTSVKTSRDLALLVCRMHQITLGLIGLTGFAAAFWRMGVPIGLAFVLIATGLTELVAFVGRLPRRLSPAIATGFVIVGVLGLVLFAVALLV